MRAYVIAAALAGVALAGTPAFAQRGVENTKGSTKEYEIPKCSRSLGTVTVTDGEGRGWVYYNLREPSQLIKVFVARSGCFKLVNRDAGLAARNVEKGLSSDGDLQRGSNVGGGQIKAADYTITADVASTNTNAGGSAIGAVAGGLIGGRFGAAVGGIRTKKVEAQTVLELVNMRTLETEAVVEGYASKRDISFGVGGGAGGVWGGGGGYENTSEGKAIGMAFLDGYRQIVEQLGGLSGNAAAEAPKRTFVAKVSTPMKRSPSNSSSTVLELDAGQMVYPLEGKEGAWWEVEDENGNVGWVDNTKLTPKK